LIYLVERRPRYAEAIQRLLDESGRDTRVVVSELARLECLVVPYRTNSAGVINAFDLLFERTEIFVAPVDRGVLERAARLRAELPTLRGADAIHLATAQLCQCQSMLTNDRRLAAMYGSSAKVLDDVVTKSS
jgi:predicted nucleic acid-binding protein